METDDLRLCLLFPLQFQRQTNRKTVKQIDRQTGRQLDRQTADGQTGALTDKAERQTDTDKHRQTERPPRHELSDIEMFILSNLIAASKTD